MAQCPKCGAPVNDDFGLIECGSCHAQLLVQIDGSVEMATPDLGRSEVESSPVDAGFEESYEEIPFQSSEDLADDAAAEPEDMFESEPEPESEPVAEGTFTAADAGDYDFGAEPDAAPESTPVNAYPDFDEPEPAGNAVETYHATSASPDLSDLAFFGNSDVSSAREGALRYNVFVTGIDTVEIRDAFREALTDRKFVWDTDQILRSIKNGECILKDVTATKAHILISRLRTLPVDISWEQYAIHQG